MTLLAFFVSAPAVAAPNLEIVKQVDKTQVPSNEEFTYSITYRCASFLENCVNATIVDDLPDNLVFTDISLPSQVNENLSIIPSAGATGPEITLVFDNIVNPPNTTGLEAGSTGVLFIKAKFPPGTVPGTQAPNTATFNADGAVSVDSSQTTTATGEFEMFAQKSGGPAVIGFPTTFNLEVCSPDSVGGVRLLNPVITDELPDAAQFVSAPGTAECATAPPAPGAGSECYAYDDGVSPRTVTFYNLGATANDPGGVIEVGSCASRQIVLLYDSDPGAGQTNSVSVTGEPEDGTDIPGDSLNAQVGFDVIEPFGAGSGGKISSAGSSFNGTEALNGEAVTYTVSAANSGFLPLENVQIVDRIPAGVDLVSWDVAPGPGGNVNGFYSTVAAPSLANPGDWVALPGNPYSSTETITPPVTGITALRWDVGTLQIGESWSAPVRATVSSDVALGTAIQNCVTVTSDTDFTDDATPKEDEACSTVTVIDERAIPRVTKTGGAGPFEPGDTQSFSVTLRNDGVAHLDLINPVLADLLPERLEIITGTVSTGAPAAGNLEVVPDYAGTGRTLLRWSWNDKTGGGCESGNTVPAECGFDRSLTLTPGQSVTVNYEALIIDNTAPGMYENSAVLVDYEVEDNPEGDPGDVLLCSGDEAYSETAAGADLNLDPNDNDADRCRGVSTTPVRVVLSAESEKFVRGTEDCLNTADYGGTTSCDNGGGRYGFGDFNKLGLTVPGGDVDYLLTLVNRSNVPLTRITITDLFPSVGDTGVIDLGNRGSQWRPNLQGPLVPLIAPTSGLTVYYSTSANPCRPELVPGGPAGCDDDWSTEFPADPTSVQAVRIDFCDENGENCAVLDLDEDLEFAWRMTAPGDVPTSPDCADPRDDTFDFANPGACLIAWNSFGFTAFQYKDEDDDDVDDGDGLQLLPAEPIRVGMRATDPVEPPRNAVGNLVWLDVAGDEKDGLQQPIEQTDWGVNGVLVKLFDAGPDDTAGTSDDVFVSEQYTGPNFAGQPGYYQFGNLPDGDYFLQFYPPEGYDPVTNVTLQEQGDGSIEPGDPDDSDGATDGYDAGPDDIVGNEDDVGDFYRTEVFNLTAANGPDGVPNSGDENGPDGNPNTGDELGETDLNWDFGLWVPTDYGDAPYDGTGDLYPTRSADLTDPADAARHIIRDGLFLGAGVDDELDGQPDFNAWGDDASPADPDDEDGVTFADYTGTLAQPSGVLLIGEDNSITVGATVPEGETGFLNAWIDFNGDGDWDDPGEQIATNLAASGAGDTLDLTISVPGNTPVGVSHARFRFSTEPDLTPRGIAIDGEVEDYQVQFIDVPDKLLTATSEADDVSAGANLAIGEVASFSISYRFPLGVTEAVTLVDEIPAGLLYLDGTAKLSRDSTDISSDENPGGINSASADVPTSVTLDEGTADELRLSLGEVNNTSGAIASYTLTFDAIVANSTGNNAGVDLVDRGRLDFTRAGAASSVVTNQVSLNLVEPQPGITKSVTPSAPSGGDEVTYTLTVRNVGDNQNDAPWFELVVTDLLPSELVSPQIVSVTQSAGVVVTPGYSGGTAYFSGNGFRAEIDRLDPNESVEFTYKATVVADAAFGDVLVNQAEVQGTSLPGDKGNYADSTKVGASGTADGERTGDGGPDDLGVNDLVATTAKTVTVALPTIAKALVAEQNRYAIGELVSYRLTVGVPVGSTNAAVVLDDLPSGLTYVPDSLTVDVPAGVTVDPDGSGGSAPIGDGGEGVLIDTNTGFFAYSPTAGLLEMTLGDVAASAAGNIVIQYLAVVDNELGNQNGTNLENSATLVFDNPGSDDPNVVITVGGPESVTATVGEPDLEITKDVSPRTDLDAGDIVTWEVVIQNTGTTTAYQVAWGDSCPEGMNDAGALSATTTPNGPPPSLAVDTGTVFFNGTTTEPTAANLTLATDIETDDSLLLDPVQIAPDGVLTVSFSCALDQDVQPGQVIINDTRAYYTSLVDGGRDNETNPGNVDDDDDADLNNYEESAQDQITVDAPIAITKTVSKSEATIGEEVTYSIRVDLIDGTTPNLTVVDLLPTGLSYISSQVIEPVTNTGLTSYDPNTDFDQTGQLLTFDLGDINNPSDGDDTNDYISIEVVVRVDNIASNQAGDEPKNGEEDEGSAVYLTYVDAGGDTQQVDFDADGNTEGLQGVPFEIVEPVLVVDKGVVPAAQSLGDLVTFTVEVRHDASTSDAFNLELVDTLPVGLTYVPGSVTGPVDLVSVNGQELTFAIASLTQLEGAKTFMYQATVDVDAVVDQPLTNRIGLVWRSLVDATGAEDDGRNGDDGEGGDRNDYATSDDAEVIASTNAFIDATKTVALSFDAATAGVVDPGDELLYTVVLTNTSTTETATDVVFEDTIPINTSFVLGSLTTSQGTPNEAGAPSLVVDVGSMAPGTAVTIAFKVAVNAGTPAGTLIRNQGSVDSAQTVPEPTDADGVDANGDQPTDIRVGGAPPLAPALYVEKLVEWSLDADVSDDVSPTDELTYFLVLENLGDTALTNVTLTDNIPVGLTYVGGSAAISAGTIGVTGQALSLAITEIPVGGFEVASFVVTIDDPLADFNGTANVETFTNQAVADSDQTDPVRSDANGEPSDGNQPTQISAVNNGASGPALDVEKRSGLVVDIDGDGLLDPGDTLGYVILVLNQGSAPATNVRLTDPIPVDTTVVPGSVASSQGLVLDENPVDVNLGTIGAGGVAAIVFEVTVDAGAEGAIIANQAEVQAAGDITEPSDDNGDNSDGKNPTLNPVDDGGSPGDPPAGLDLDKVLHETSNGSDPKNLLIGEVVTYRVSVQVPAGTTSQVVVRDQLPTGLSYVASSGRLARSFDVGLSASLNPGLINSAPVDSLVALADGGAFNVSGQDLTLALGGVINSDSDGNVEEYVLEYQASVDAIAGGTELNNSAELDYLNGLGQPSTLGPVVVELDVSDKVAIGNRVWLDDGAGSGTANNGVLDGTEAGIDGVVVELYDSSNNPVDSTVTADGGYYYFDNLDQGDYYVLIPASEFGNGEPLDGLLSSLGAGGDETSDNGTDENGVDDADAATNGIRSNSFSLGPNTEVTGEDQSFYPGGLPDASVNATNDFAFIDPADTLVAIGNRVWLDDGVGNGVANNGAIDGAEAGIDGVVVRLFDSADNPIASTVTADGGYYYFDNLAEGEYYVLIPASEFGSGEPLEGLFSSFGAGSDETTDEGTDENGIDDADPAANGIRSNTFQLEVGSEASGEDQTNYAGVLPDANVNATDDFGFARIDWGDLPNAGAGGDNAYPTTAGDGGPSHVIVDANPVLGVQVDAEADGQPTALADGDDTAAFDDEDGVTFPVTLTQGETLDLTYTALDPTGAGGGADALLYAWIDWNGDGDFADLNEQVANGVLPGDQSGGANTLTVTVPVDAVAGEDLGVRFRYSSDATANDPAARQAADGEIEDYLIEVTAAQPGSLVDWGDLPDADDGNATPGSQSYPTTATDGGEGVGASHVILAENNPVLGVQVDAEGDGAPDATATGDDSAAYDDEDGVSIPALERGQTVDIEYSVIDLVGDARLNAFIDWNGDGDFADPFEQVANDVDPANKDGSANTLSVTVPVDAVTGIDLGVRFRLSNDTGLSATGAAASGEVEDYLVQVTEAQGELVDWGDLPDANDNNGTPGSQSYPTNATDGGEGVGASHIILAENNPVLGDGVDAEGDGVPGAAATGDDLAGLDDEDGVSIPPLTQGATVDIEYTVNDPTGTATPNDPGDDARLYAWIDWNGDGDFEDVGEQIAANVIPADQAGGTNTLSVTVPADATTGTALGVRFRYSTDPAAGSPTGQAGNGEVEDYLVQEVQAAAAGSQADWGDLPDSYGTTAGANGPSHTILAQDNPRLGATIDADNDGQPSAAADGDDNGDLGGDDEDGVTLPTLTAGREATITYVVNDPAGNAVLNAWIDWNGNGAFDAGEQIATNLVPANKSGTNELEIDVPSGAVTGTEIGVRFRLSNDTGLSAIGAAASGEVEDYLVTIKRRPVPPPPDPIPAVTPLGLAFLTLLIGLIGAAGSRRVRR